MISIPLNSKFTNNLSKEFAYRRQIALKCGYKEVTGRLIGFLDWMNTMPVIERLLKQLRKTAQPEKLLYHGSGDYRFYNQDFEARTVEEIAGVGLELLAEAKSRRKPLYQLGNDVGIRSGKWKDNADSDAVVIRFIIPFLDYVEQRLPVQENEKNRGDKPKQTKQRSVTPVPNLKFVKDRELRSFASVAAQEACNCFDATAFNAAAVMAGSATEAALLDLLLQHKVKLNVGNKPLEEWRLVDLIGAALKLNLLGKATGNLTQIVRQHRNLIHPGRSLREKNSIGRGEAEITMGILRLVCDELS